MFNPSIPLSPSRRAKQAHVESASPSRHNLSFFGVKLPLSPSKCAEQPQIRPTTPTKYPPAKPTTPSRRVFGLKIVLSPSKRTTQPPAEPTTPSKHDRHPAVKPTTPSRCETQPQIEPATPSRPRKQKMVDQGTPRRHKDVSTALNGVKTALLSEWSFDSIRGRLIHALNLPYTPDDWQCELIRRIWQGYDSLLIAGTGYGKSLIFEGLAALGDKEKKLVFIICPLKALQKDQVCASHPFLYLCSYLLSVQASSCKRLES
jgi:hypothetical protein